MATTGLDSRETKQLAAKLALLDKILERDFLLGCEARPMRELAARMRTRLEPPDPSEMMAEADRLVARNVGVYFVDDALREFA